MAFLKYAKATIQKPGITFSEWDSLRQGAVLPAPDFQKRTAKIILQEYQPDKYMLSHATIVASVDVENASAALGRHFVEGFEVDRKYTDYYITPKTAQYVNNNNDAFERRLLLACFKTFVGAQSYIEHVQIPELSKGRIIDAAARDVGDSIYIDILIANDLKHAPLIRAIKNGQLGTLSMGCSTSETTCTKCGNVAYDEAQLCSCVRYFKGNKFRDEQGIERIIAELCGHATIPDSVKFIEASWVANPAFKGAVLRNILSAEELQGLEGKMHKAFSLPIPVADPGSMPKAAYQLRGQEEQFTPDDVPEEGGEEAPEPEKPEDDPFQKAVTDLTEALTNKVVQNVREQINKEEVDEIRRVDPNQQNETLIRSALRHPEWRKIARMVISFVGKAQTRKVLRGLILYKCGGWPLVKTAGFTGKDRLAISRTIDLMAKNSFTAGETRVYRTVLNVGGTGPYEDVETYLAACRQVLGRTVTGSEAASLLEKGRLYSERS
jgi:ribosomal protein L37E